jgi:hypothetical protein
VLGHVDGAGDALRGQAGKDTADDIDLLEVVDDRGVADESANVLAGGRVGDEADEGVREWLRGRGGALGGYQARGRAPTLSYRAGPRSGSQGREDD